MDRLFFGYVAAALLIGVGFAVPAAGQSSEPRAEPQIDADALHGPAPCGSAVIVRCGPRNPAAATPGSLADEGERARSQLGARRQELGLRAGTLDDDVLEPIVVTGRRLPNARQAQWRRFNEQVERAAEPDCLGLGNSAGLLALPLAPILALSGHCR